MTTLAVTRGSEVTADQVLFALESDLEAAAVQEAELARVRLGAKVAIVLSGRPAPVEGTIRYVATQPEFTPPVIYSRENRAKLVFMVEAHPAPELATTLHPGQPVEVRLQP